jgi:trimeric autotransporter adhesin
MSGPSGPTYRSATARTDSVTQVIDSVGTLSAVNKATVRFPVSGRVASVAAVVGNEVTAGEVLATLDTSTLDQQLNQAKQMLASDQQKLANDQTSQLSTSTTFGSSSNTSAATADSAEATPLTPTTTPTSAVPAGFAKPATSSPSAQVAVVAAAQRRLTRDQQALDAILSAASLKELQSLIATSGPCALIPAPATTFVATSDPDATITVTTPGKANVTAGTATVSQPQQGDAGYTYTIVGDPSTAYTVTITPATGVIDTTTCTTAIQKLVAVLDPDPTDSAWADSQAVTADELALASAISKLEKAGSSDTSRGGSKPSTSTSPRSTSAASSGRASGSSSARTSGSSIETARTTASPEQIVADEAAIDAAGAELDVAEQSREQATIRTPIAGTVAAVGLSVGSAAGSNAVTIVGPGAHEVLTTVSLTDVGLVKTGETASVKVDGVGSPISGRVTTIGILNSTTGSTTTYPITVLLGASSAQLFDGAGAAVAITVGQVSNVLTVPSSAVHSVRTLHTVTVLSGGKTTTSRVGVGAVGVDRTEITSGLKAGQRVVLAQIDAPLPSSGTTTRRGLGGTGIGGAGLTGGRTRFGG